MATESIHHESGQRREVPLAIWPVAQTSAQWQPAGRYLGRATHPAKMLPALAARIVTEYSREDDLVLDPMCEVGTTVVEAALLGRRAVGVETEPRWLALARANIEHALGVEARERSGHPEARRGDARALPKVLGPLTGTVDLVVVCPPCGRDAGVIDKRAWRAGGRLCPPDPLNYSSDAANLGQLHGRPYVQAMRQVYAGCFAALRPGGLLVTVTKNTRRAERPLDLAGLTASLAGAAGFAYLQHVIALRAAIRDGALYARPSSWQLSQLRRARAQGQPAHLVVHEDVCVFVRPEASVGSGKSSAPWSGAGVGR